MTKTPRSFNADEETQALLTSEVTIAGRKFTPARLTPDVRKSQMTIQVEDSKLIRRDALDKPAIDVTDEQIDRRLQSVTELDGSVYRQLSVLLVDGDDKPPTEAFLRKELDFRVAKRLLTWLGEEDEGESETATTPQAGSA